MILWLRVTTTWRSVLKGHSVRKVENPCCRVLWWAFSVAIPQTCMNAGYELANSVFMQSLQIQCGFLQQSPFSLSCHNFQVLDMTCKICKSYKVLRKDPLTVIGRHSTTCCWEDRRDFLFLGWVRGPGERIWEVWGTAAVWLSPPLGLEDSVIGVSAEG